MDTYQNNKHLELMQFHQSNIKVAGYLTLLPPKKLLLEKFHKAIEIARGQMDNKLLDKDKLGE